MVAVHIKNIRGTIPRISPRLLQPNQATRATNLRITSGRLDPLPGTELVASPMGNTGKVLETIFRYRHKPEGGATIDNWLAWSEQVDCVGSLLAGDSKGRVYFSSDDFEPRMTTYADAIVSQPPYPKGWYVLGLPLPTDAPSVAVAGGTTPVETRAYAYTFVTQYGEESGPSPASTTLSGNINGTWTVTNLQTAPPNTGTITAVENVTPGEGFVRLTLNTVFGLEAYERLTIAGVTGMTDLNGSQRIVSVDSASKKIVLALTTAQTYTAGGTWTREAPHNVTGMTKRLYRSTGSEGQFMFVTELPVATTSYVDTLASSALGEMIPTLDSVPPPKNLRCLSTLPNGCLVGLAGNELCFSDPYLPYSWPIRNRYSFSGTGVAQVSAGNSVIVLTDSFPILFTGTDPEAMSPSAMETYAPCASKRGVVNVGGGALYPSFDGIWLATPGRVDKITAELFTEVEFSLLNPASFIAEVHDNHYLASYQEADGSRKYVLSMNVTERDSVTKVEETLEYLLRNEYDGKLYVVKDNTVHEWAADDTSRFRCDWISGTLVAGVPTNFAVAQVHADFQADVPADTTQIANNEALVAAGPDAVAGHLDGHELGTVEINGSYIIPAAAGQVRDVQFTLYADGVAVFTRGVKDSTPFRLPAGYRSEVFNVGLNANVPTYSVAVAQSIAELKETSA